MAEGLSEPPAPIEAKTLIRSILREGKIRYSSHARLEMRADDLIESDVVSVLRSGIVAPAELRRERPEVARTWRYAVHTARAESCLRCGAAMRSTVENRKYTDVLPVILENVRVLRCPECGEEEIELPAVEKLHSVIATAVARQPARLSPGEIRWLRTHLGYSSVDFANLMGVAPETVSRWESLDKPQRMSLSAERLLRLMTLQGHPIEDYGLEHLGEAEAPPRGLRIAERDGGWTAKPA